MHSSLFMGVRIPADERLRVAIAEDDDLLREALEEALLQENIEVITLEDGFELADYVAARLTRWADVIVSDLMMPGRPGIEGLELARRSGLKVPIVVVSGDTRPEMIARVANLGNALFISKPFDVERLARAVRQLCGLTNSPD